MARENIFVTDRLGAGQRIHHNFVKPHAALEGQTPAHVAGIGVGGKDKWMELLRSALR